MKTILFTTMLLGLTIYTYAQKGEETCVNCTSNGFSATNASVLGTDNGASGNSSIAGGQECYSSGNASVSFGYRCTSSSQGAFAAGTISQANGLYSIAIGHAAISGGQDDIAIGKFVTSSSIASSYTFGIFLTSNSPYSMTIGKGWSDNERLRNNIDKSLMIGFNSNAPTLFIGPNTSLTDPSLTGKIGIGNETDPQAKLHIKADRGEVADLFLEPNEEGTVTSAKLYLATIDHRIEAKISHDPQDPQDLSFYSGHNFIFNDGYVGIGTRNPEYNLDVNGNLHSLEIESDSIVSDNIRGSYIDGESIVGDDLTITNNTTDWASTIENQNDQGKGLLVKAGTYTYANPIFEVQDKDGNSVLFTMANQGKVGIGTTSPQSKLDVAGTVRMTGLNLPTNAVDGYVLTSNSTGIASWIDPTLSYYWQKNATGDLYYSDQGHKVGINTNNPSYTLDVEGNLGVKDNLTGKSSSSYDALYLSGSELSSSAKIEIGRGVNKKGIKIICPDPAGDIQMHFNSIPAVFIQSDAANFGSTNHEMDLNVNGKIQATEVEVMINIWQDQVFENNYPLMDLNSLERFINENHHLPEIPSEEEVISNGINVGEMNALLLKKIEELTLYVIDLKKENDLIKTKLESLMQEE